MEQLRNEAEKLAEERRKAREQAMEWSREAKVESEEERERRPKKAKKEKAEKATKVEQGSADEAEPKKKRRGKLKKVASEQGEEEIPVFTDEEDVEKPAKKVCGSVLFLNLPCLYHFSGLLRRESSGMRMKKTLAARAKSNCKYKQLSEIELGSTDVDSL